MNLDDMKTTWAAQTALLERSLVINERLLHHTVSGRVRRALVPSIAWRALELLLGILAAVAVVGVIGDHVESARYLLLGGVTLAFTVGLTALTVHRVALGTRLDAGSSVVTMQQTVERLARAEVLAFTWALLGGILLWLPIVLLVIEALTGVDALARVALRYLVANLAFGGAVLVSGLVLARRYLTHPDPGPRARRVIDALTGRSLRAARAELAALAAFARD